VLYLAKGEGIMCCLICRDLDHLTSEEVMRNIGEMLKGASREQSAHLLDLASKILDKDVPMEETDPGLDESWFSENMD